MPNTASHVATRRVRLTILVVLSTRKSAPSWSPPEPANSLNSPMHPIASVSCCNPSVTALGVVCYVVCCVLCCVVGSPHPTPTPLRGTLFRTAPPPDLLCVVLCCVVFCVVLCCVVLCCGVVWCGVVCRCGVSVRCVFKIFVGASKICSFPLIPPPPDPLPRSSPSTGLPKISLFFPSPAPFSLFLSLSGCLLVEFWCCF